MHILHLSDTHNSHRQLGNLPAADVIIHSGDISFTGTGKEIMDFIDWFCQLDYQYKIFIAGNHDYALQGKDSRRIQRFLPKGCYYLYNSGITINGVNFWGLPFFLNPVNDDNYHQQIQQIPTQTDILITHQPLFGILDQSNKIHYGNPHLFKRVNEIQPHYHLFGHIHDAHGIEKHLQTIFSNASIMDGTYQLVNKPTLFEI